ncbi:MAG: 5-formyltetrahydrofolate cyclo-ligase [Steroidobacteraceae bacterium]
MPSSWEEIRVWRKQQRERLLAERIAAPVDLRLEQGAAAKRNLRDAVDVSAHPAIGIYWPLRAEMDVRDLARAHVEAGGIAALPVVVTRNAAVEFWRWEPGMKMGKGIWDIPIPATRELVHPSLLIVPLVGFDAGCYRLGYGGGYYDRTIAGAAPRPLCVGLGFSSAALPCIFPQPHDIPMQMIVTERGVQQR